MGIATVYTIELISAIASSNHLVRCDDAGTDSGLKNRRVQIPSWVLPAAGQTHISWCLILLSSFSHSSSLHHQTNIQITTGWEWVPPALSTHLEFQQNAAQSTSDRCANQSEGNMYVLIWETETDKYKGRKGDTRHGKQGVCEVKWVWENKRAKQEKCHNKERCTHCEKQPNMDMLTHTVAAIWRHCRKKCLCSNFSEHFLYQLFNQNIDIVLWDLGLWLLSSLCTL